MSEQAFRDLGLGDEDVAEWRLSGAPMEDWLTDRVARRPSGTRAREVYGAGDVHAFARRAILDALALRPGDRLLEVGCGGGILLSHAIAAGAAATGVDHSEEMVRLARERAPGATVVQAKAEQLPFATESFDAVAMSMVFLFFADPARVLRECARVLAADGRLAIYTTAPELKGSPAAPEPIASRCLFHSDQTLCALATQARFLGVSVVNDGGGQLLTGRRDPAAAA